MLFFSGRLRSLKITFIEQDLAISKQTVKQPWHDRDSFLRCCLSVRACEEKSPNVSESGKVLGLQLTQPEVRTDY